MIPRFVRIFSLLFLFSRIEREISTGEDRRSEREDESQSHQALLEKEERSRRHRSRGDWFANQRLAQVPREQECGDWSAGGSAGPVDTLAQHADLQIGAGRASRCRAPGDQVLQLFDQAQAARSRGLQAIRHARLDRGRVTGDRQYPDQEVSVE